VAVCIFCAKRATSDEHLWPNWLLGLIGREGYSIEYRRPDRPPVVIRGPDPALKRRIVCKGCNEGWMNALERGARPLLTALFHDVALSLDAESQRAITLWAVKTAMVLEALRSANEGWFYQPSDRHALRELGTPPEFTRTWIARFAGDSPLTSNIAGFGPSVNGATAIWGSCSTLTLGHLALQVVSLRADLPVLCDRVPWAATTVCVWPVDGRTVWWPPPISLGDDGTPNLVDFWTRWKLG